MKLNDLTFVLSVFFLPIWLVWELAALWMRSKGVVGGALPGSTSEAVGTISMVMKNRGYQLTVLPFFWSAMAAHWWVNDFDGRTWESPIPAILFWVLVTATLASDVFFWNTPFNALNPTLKFYRAPMVQVVAGFLAAYWLFPQSMVRLPGWRWW